MTSTNSSKPTETTQWSIKAYKARDVAGRKVGWTWTWTRWGRSLSFGTSPCLWKRTEGSNSFDSVFSKFTDFLVLCCNYCQIQNDSTQLFIISRVFYMAFHADLKSFPGGLGPGRLAGDQVEMLWDDWLLSGKIESWRGFTWDFSWV